MVAFPLQVCGPGLLLLPINSSETQHVVMHENGGPVTREQQHPEKQTRESFRVRAAFLVEG